MFRSSLRIRRGAVLIEALVALTILAVGALALARTEVASSRLAGAARSATLAASLAAHRFEALHTGNCTPASGLDSATDVVAYWRTVGADGVAFITDSVVVRSNLSAHPRIERFRSAVPCQ